MKCCLLFAWVFLFVTFRRGRIRYSSILLNTAELTRKKFMQSKKFMLIHAFFCWKGTRRIWLTITQCFLRTEQALARTFLCVHTTPYFLSFLVLTMGFFRLRKKKQNKTKQNKQTNKNDHPYRECLNFRLFSTFHSMEFQGVFSPTLYTYKFRTFKGENHGFQTTDYYHIREITQFQVLFLLFV